MEWNDPPSKCNDCGKMFDLINEESTEEHRCIDCQTAFRINNANHMHRLGIRVHYDRSFATWDIIHKLSRLKDSNELYPSSVWSFL